MATLVLNSGLLRVRKNNHAGKWVSNNLLKMQIIFVDRIRWASTGKKGMDRPYFVVEVFWNER